MRVWIDAQLSPKLAEWLTDEFGVDASALKSLGLRDAGDHEIFVAGNTSNAALQVMLRREFSRALELFAEGERLVEIHR